MEHLNDARETKLLLGICIAESSAWWLFHRMNALSTTNVELILCLDIYPVMRDEWAGWGSGLSGLKSWSFLWKGGKQREWTDSFRNLYQDSVNAFAISPDPQTPSPPVFSPHNSYLPQQQCRVPQPPTLLAEAKMNCHGDCFLFSLQTGSNTSQGIYWIW